MQYKYELHSHTGLVSLCASIEPTQLIKIYEKNGYSGIVLTDHYSPMTFYRTPFTPEHHTDYYLQSYRKLKEYCGSSFTVLLGMELRHYGTVNDYLVYGIEENWLTKQGNMLLWNESKMSEEIHREGYLVYQAHPYRKFITRCNPDLIDGIEVYNGHTDAIRNRKAFQLASRLGKPMISGSDFHKPSDKALGGITVNKPILSNADLLSVLKTGEYGVLMPVSAENAVQAKTAKPAYGR